jgi:hypothetical protein
MRVDASGNVGIGTSSPSAALEVNSGTDNLVAVFKSTDTEAQIDLVDSTGSAQIRSRNDLRFYTNGGAVRAMDIDSSGKVGIGTSSPKNPLNVIDDNNDTTMPTLGVASGILNLSIDTNDYGLLAGVNYSTGDSWLQAQRTDGTATAYNLLLQPSGGNVGIGTSSPDAKLKIDAGATAGAWVRADNYGLRVSAGSTSAHYALRIADSNDATMATFNGDGNVGIGTSSPTEALHISSGGLLIDSYIPNAPASGTSGLIADYAGTNARFWSRGNATTRGGFEFKSLESDGGNQIDAMRIDSSGRVTTPNQPAWNVGLNGAQTISAAGDVVLWDKASGGSNFVSGGVTLNGANGRITLPVAGKYLIVAAMRTEASGGVTGTNINLRLNGATLTRFYVGTCLNSGGSYMNIEPRPFVVNAQASDYLYYDFDGLPSSIILSASTNTVVSFSGYLIG